MCHECNGKCCRNELGYRVVHMGAYAYTHCCDACNDGTVVQPDPRDAEIAKWRDRAVVYRSTLEVLACFGDSDNRTLRTVADMCLTAIQASEEEIARRAHGLAVLREASIRDSIAKEEGR